MSWFDEEDETASAADRGLEATPGALEDAWDAVGEAASTVTNTVGEVNRAIGQAVVDDATQMASEVQQAASDEYDHIAADPTKALLEIEQSLGAPKVVNEDGHLSVQASIGPIAAAGFDYEDGRGFNASASLGQNVGGHLPNAEGHIAFDDDGSLQKLGGNVNVSVPLEGGAWVGVKNKAEYHDTADGGAFSFNANPSFEPVPGQPGFQTNLHGSFATHDNGDYDLNAGAGGGLAEFGGRVGGQGGEDMIEGGLVGGLDLDLSSKGGQTTFGVRPGVTGDLTVAGQQIFKVRSETGVAYETGPDGERVIVHGGASGLVNVPGVGNASVQASDDFTLTPDDDGNVSIVETQSASYDVTSKPLGVDEHGGYADVSDPTIVSLDGALDAVVLAAPVENAVSPDLAIPQAEPLENAISPDLGLAPMDAPLENAISPDLGNAPMDAPLENAISPDIELQLDEPLENATNPDTHYAGGDTDYATVESEYAEPDPDM